jgi:hypothetical protein
VPLRFGSCKDYKGCRFLAERPRNGFNQFLQKTVLKDDANMTGFEV